MSAQSPIAQTPSRLVAIVGSTIARPARSTLMPASRDDRRWLDAAGPHHRSGRDELVVADQDAILPNLPERRAEVQLEAALAELAVRVGAHLRLLLGQDAVLELHDVDPKLIGPDLRIEAPADAPHEVLDLAGGLDPAEAGATDHEGELSVARIGILLEVGTLEHLDDPIAERERIGQGLHADRVLGECP